MSHFVCENISVNSDGTLLFAGQNTVQLAQKYGTPLYLLDENRIREKCRSYTEALTRNFGAGSHALYASKANSFVQIYRIMKEEQMWVDVVSSGEMYTALKAGFPSDGMFFHSNGKTDEDIRFAIANHIGFFVVDGIEELIQIDKEAEKAGMIQNVLLRITPGIDPHTYEEVSTGKVDSKFGSAIQTGQAEEITKAAIGLKSIHLSGFHCHVGSQVFAEDVFERAAAVMLEFIADMKRKFQYSAEYLDLGGGFGVPYVLEDGTMNIQNKIDEIAAVVHETCRKLDIQEPLILMEPGRSIVADAGMTLYTVEGVKKIPGYKNYVAIDGGMADNPRFALYKAKYTCLTANKVSQSPVMKASLVGRCCESGDIIQENVDFPEVTRGDIVAVCTTGAYNYSMASNYNRLGRPPIVMLKDGTSYIAVRRESLDDLIRLDL